MICAWKELLCVLPNWVAEQVDKNGRETGQEIRLRLDSKPELVCSNQSVWLRGTVRKEDLDFCINAASRYSPWAAHTSAFGYLTAAGGHRIGICGDAIIKDGSMSGIRCVSSLCIRIARDFPDISKRISQKECSVLIVGPPGSGKTTFLRDLVRQISRDHAVSVVDERGELFPAQFAKGNRMDVLTGCPKGEGIDAVLRTMGPEFIAVDEITAAQDCEAMIHAAWCGVRFIATAHALTQRDLQRRQLYRPLLEQEIFDQIIVMKRDKTWREERLITC